MGAEKIIAASFKLNGLPGSLEEGVEVEGVL